MPEKRKYLTKAQKRFWHHVYFGQCAMCRAFIPPFGPGVHWDHRNPLGLTGTNEDDNWQPLCDVCDAIKTPADQRRIAKAKRLVAREDGTRRPRKAIPGRKLGDAKLKRGFDGKVSNR